jgi:hypothetical protein
MQRTGVVRARQLVIQRDGVGKRGRVDQHDRVQARLIVGSDPGQILLHDLSTADVAAANGCARIRDCHLRDFERWRAAERRSCGTSAKERSD